jgi:hypothetical protein
MAQRDLAAQRGYWKIELCLFLILVLSFSYFFPRWADWSQNSRLDLVLAVVDQGTLKIDDYYHNTGDYALFEGHYYMDKAPGPSFLGIPVYAVLRPVLQLEPVQNILDRVASSPVFASTINEDSDETVQERMYAAIVLYAVTFAVSVLPSAFLGVLMFRFMMQVGVAAHWAVLTTLAYGLGTNAFTYSGVFYSHQLTAVLLFAAFYIGFQIKRGTHSPRWVIAAGLLLGYSIISEYPTFLIALGVFVYIIMALWPLAQERWRWIGAFILAGTPPGIALALYNLAIFRTPLPVGYQYSELWVEEHDTGFLSLSLPHAEALWGISFGDYRGLFFVAPVLLLAIAGFWTWWRSGQYRRELMVCLYATLAFFFFNASSAMWHGGFGVGPRYLVPMLPFFATGLGAFLMRWGDVLWGRVLFAILLLCSVLNTWIQTLGGQSFPDYTLSPLVNYSLPHWAEGNIARNLGMILGLRGIPSLLPLLLILAVIGAVLVWQLRRVKVT